MACVAGLLPGNPADTSFTFDKVMQEATVALYQDQEDDVRERARADRHALEKALTELSESSDQENENNDTIFFKGLKLGKELEECIGDGELRWKVLAEF